MTDVEDYRDFVITGGSLTFKEAPDYENPADDSEDAVDDSDSVYNVVLAIADASGNTSYSKITVQVTNVDEPGTVTMNHLQPQVGVTVTATLTDPDGAATGHKCQWYQGTTMIAGARMEAYTPAAGDVGASLVAKVTYRDPEDSDTDKMAEGTSDYTVRAEPTELNTPPAFPDEDPDTTGQQTNDREIAENTNAGMNIGSPVTANDSAA